MLYGTFAAAGMPYMGVGRNLAYRKDVWQKSGGFDAHLHYTGGDDDLTVGRLSNSRNTVCCFHPEAQVFSTPKRNFSDWFRQKRRHLSVSSGYRHCHLFWLGLQASTHAFQMVAGVLLLPWYPVAVITALLLRWVVGLVVFKRVSTLLQASDLYLFFPVLDGLMGVFYTFFVPAIWLLRRSNTW
jgi:cellulose synthase/poly-beta-1,6-N-acetylglucosamine synthase-like glycosyltransferase